MHYVVIPSAVVLQRAGVEAAPLSFADYCDRFPLSDGRYSSPSAARMANKLLAEIQSLRPGDVWAVDTAAFTVLREAALSPQTPDATPLAWVSRQLVPFYDVFLTATTEAPSGA